MRAPPHRRRAESWSELLAAADLRALRRRAPGGLVGPKVGTPAVPRMGPTSGAQPPAVAGFGVALNPPDVRRVQRERRLATPLCQVNATSRGCTSPDRNELPSLAVAEHPYLTGVRRRNRQRLRPARRPPTAKRPQIRRRQPAEMPPARTALGAERPLVTRRSPFHRRQPAQTPPERAKTSQQPRRRQPAPRPPSEDAGSRQSQPAPAPLTRPNPVEKRPATPTISTTAS